jgi:hypothetical protein
MRRAALLLACTLVATMASGATSFFLDRNGVLWSGSSSDEGLVLTGQRDAEVITRTTVPFVLGFSVNQDVAIQVAADEVTGKVVVVWQRNWTTTASEIMMAVWKDGNWERIEHLSHDLLAYPRNPAIQLTNVATNVPNPDNPEDPTGATIVQDSFLHVVWWEGQEQSHGSYALVRLTAEPGDADAVTEQDLDSYATLGFACKVAPPPAVLEHPLFADEYTGDGALLFFGTQRQCLFHLLGIRFTLETTPVTGSDGITVIAQRRRHVPIFGLKKTFELNREMAMEGTRVILGKDLAPVAYRVQGATVQYVTYGEQGWSPLRTLAVRDGLTMDQAIPLVEKLAR